MDKVKLSFFDLTGKLAIMDVDLTMSGIHKQMVDQALAKFVHIDILINNVGMIKRNSLFESKDEAWDKVININLNPVFHMSMAKQNSEK